MSKLVVTMLLGSLLCACSSGPVRVHGADVSVDDTRIRVSDGGNGTFCPPGQAKKGRC
ncbi:hypothetical protein FGF01_15925 [Aeromonas salmonicida subsp. achromogenes]|jgi:hypothetical protein|uniref:Lipoprotein n=2 Tax=Gammaproteobacteria TaxID=1236 RepID=A0A3L0VWW7_ECOLX|nr:hypothetical protein [Aeromonas salmonicida]ATP11104.1 uncharacterized protein Asalp_40280 [Aeromonas salmonicida subsp. pectinolytica 34mel]EQC05034.1 hypothetical protein K931_07371 [Aeromonas salmonicida subsp. pectinolytica 34mel]MDQ1884875.1 hypothetical protein [Aeromonas salmonicida]TMX08165.1 hypothetical protein FGF01_15925 [Aeromonas salmonicida subsp. achromogenes]TMX09834.1 hypothetical protein FGE99_15305 [Aeromonas salmonicida subsp. achromogenes]